MAVIGLIALHMVPPILRPRAFFQDDSYFYMQIASTLRAAPAAPSMGLLRPMVITLWMAGAVLAAFLADGNKILALHIAVVMQTLLTLAAALLFHRLLRMMGLEHGVLGRCCRGLSARDDCLWLRSASQCVDVDCGNDLALALHLCRSPVALVHNWCDLRHGHPRSPG